LTLVIHEAKLISVLYFTSDKPKTCHSAAD